jgi:hypothetical protein
MKKNPRKYPCYKKERNKMFDGVSVLYECFSNISRIVILCLGRMERTAVTLSGVLNISPRFSMSRQQSNIYNLKTFSKYFRN